MASTRHFKLNAGFPAGAPAYSGGGAGMLIVVTATTSSAASTGIKGGSTSYSCLTYPVSSGETDFTVVVPSASSATVYMTATIMRLGGTYLGSGTDSGATGMTYSSYPTIAKYAISSTSKRYLPEGFVSDCHSNRTSPYGIKNKWIFGNVGQAASDYGNSLIKLSDMKTTYGITGIGSTGTELPSNKYLTFGELNFVESSGKWNSSGIYPFKGYLVWRSVMVLYIQNTTGAALSSLNFRFTWGGVYFAINVQGTSQNIATGTTYHPTQDNNNGSSSTPTDMLGTHVYIYGNRNPSVKIDIYGGGGGHISGTVPANVGAAGVTLYGSTIDDDVELKQGTIMMVISNP